MVAEPNKFQQFNTQCKILDRLVNNCLVRNTRRIALKLFVRRQFMR